MRRQWTIYACRAFYYEIKVNKESQRAHKALKSILLNEKKIKSPFKIPK